jgi:hypothetical protein
LLENYKIVRYAQIRQVHKWLKETVHVQSVTIKVFRRSESSVSRLSEAMCDFARKGLIL